MQLPKLQCLQQHTDHPVYYDLQKNQHIWNSSPETSRASNTFVFLHVTDMNSLQCWPMMDSMVWHIYGFFVCLWIQGWFIVSPQALYYVLPQSDYQVTKKQSWHSFLTAGFDTAHKVGMKHVFWCRLAFFTFNFSVAINRKLSEAMSKLQ